MINVLVSMTTPREIYERSLEALKVIKEAQARGLVHRTPLIRSETLSNIAGANVWLKLEALQKTGSFKVRGAYFAINNVVNKLGVKHVVTASAGNHAQGVAYSASLVGIKATVVMPQYTPWIKIARTKRYGADVILHGESYSEAEDYAVKLAKEMGGPIMYMPIMIQTS